jgi:hypothetical protein
MVRQAVGAAELVDHQRHVGARAAHVEQHVEHRKRRRHEHHPRNMSRRLNFLGVPQYASTSLMWIMPITSSSDSRWTG